MQGFIRQISLSLLLMACDPPQPVKEKAQTRPDPAYVRERMVVPNRQLAIKENDILDAYARTYRLPFVKTPSGIRYHIYEHSPRGDSIRPGMTITMDYEVRLIDGTPCYSSLEEGPKTFVVGEEDIESGIHRGVQYLKRGDKALILIPSPLAHGLLGDLRKIPPQMPIVYDVKVR